MVKDFEIPDFLKGENYDEIISRMLNELPDTISKEENGWVCDLFSPVAIEHSRAIQFILLEAIKNIIPKYSYGDILLGHAENRGIYRREATYAKAVLKVSGIAGTIIPKRFQFSTVAELENSGIVFSSLQEVVIPETGVTEISVQCKRPGKIGNVASDTIILMVKPLKGIISIRNELAAYGGYDKETEDSIRQRISEFDLAQGNSFVGAHSDYRRWASEVIGVGNVQVIPSENDMGTVTIVLTDVNGLPANEELCQSVYNYIMRTDLPFDRLAPINAMLRVIPAETIELTVSANIVLSDSFNVENVKSDFIATLNSYLRQEKLKTVKYSEIGALLININGISDYNNLLLNGGSSNITINNGCIPIVKNNGVMFTI